ncbi:hypothetical protein BIU97_14705 [Curtobacterium sp. MCBA15_009]|nr:hypothetical protein BIU97_14705 [Curtobacterium sp. MCBA15_009]
MLPSVVLPSVGVDREARCGSAPSVRHHGNVRIERWGTGRRRFATGGVVAAVAVAVVGAVALWSGARSDDQEPVARVDTVDHGTARVPAEGLVPSNGLGDTVPDSGEQARPVDTSPVEPWWLRVPPVAGEVVGVGGAASGHVRIARLGGEDAIEVHVDGLRTRARSGVSVVLAAGTVPADGDPRTEIPGTSVELAQFQASERELSITVGDPWSLPEEVRSLVLTDTATGEVVGSATLVPVG